MKATSFIEKYKEWYRLFQLPINEEEMAAWALKEELSDEVYDYYAKLFELWITKKQEKTTLALKKFSRIPQINSKTFDNFDFSKFSKNDQTAILSLKSLTFISSHRNIIMIGPTGTGKTHLAMAIGNECIENGIKVYFIKMDELKTKFHEALSKNEPGSLIESLSKVSCLIIDEVGYCKFSKAETLLFFQLADRMSMKQTGSMILTSNKDASLWPNLFDEDDALECAIDRIWDTAMVFHFSGTSYRGTNQKTININTSNLKK